MIWKNKRGLIHHVTGQKIRASFRGYGSFFPRRKVVVDSGWQKEELSGSGVVQCDRIVIHGVNSRWFAFSVRQTRHYREVGGLARVGTYPLRAFGDTWSTLLLVGGGDMVRCLVAPTEKKAFVEIQCTKENTE